MAPLAKHNPASILAQATHHPLRVLARVLGFCGVVVAIAIAVAVAGPHSIGLVLSLFHILLGDLTYKITQQDTQYHIYCTKTARIQSLQNHISNENKTYRLLKHCANMFGR